MTDAGTLAIAGLGLGLLHSLELDHVAAMCTLVGKGWRSTAGDAIRGAVWGLGHTLALGTLGLLLAVAGTQTSRGAERILEAGVGAVLVGLGVLRLREARRGQHDRPGRRHAPLWIGILHGVAGSGAVLALVPALFAADPMAYLAYILAFGLGSTVGMSALCAGLGGMAQGLHWFATTAGSVGIVVGTVWLLRATL